MYYKESWLDKLDRKFGRHAIPNLMTILIICTIAAWGLNYIMYFQTGMSFSSYLTFDRDLIFQGQVWRLITFLLLNYRLLHRGVHQPFAVSGVCHPQSQFPGAAVFHPAHSGEVFGHCGRAVSDLADCTGKLAGKGGHRFFPAQFAAVFRGRSVPPDQKPSPAERIPGFL